jgi:beta-galactosidase
LVADRKSIQANSNDLCYVSVEVVDEKGNVVPYVDDIEISYQLTGNATIAGVANGSYNDATSFQQNHKKVYQGRGLVIVRPNSKSGTIVLKATANGLKEGATSIIIK